MRWGEAVKAVVVLRSEMNCTEDEILAFCRPRLGGFERPRSVDFLRSCPAPPPGRCSSACCASRTGLDASAASAARSSAARPGLACPLDLLDARHSQAALRTRRGRRRTRPRRTAPGAALRLPPRLRGARAYASTRAASCSSKRFASRTWSTNPMPRPPRRDAATGEDQRGCAPFAYQPRQPVGRHPGEQTLVDRRQSDDRVRVATRTSQAAAS